MQARPTLCLSLIAEDPIAASLSLLIRGIATLGRTLDLVGDWGGIGDGNICSTGITKYFAQRTAVMNEQYGSLGLELGGSWINFFKSIVDGYLRCGRPQAKT